MLILVATVMISTDTMNGFSVYSRNRKPSWNISAACWPIPSSRWHRLFVFCKRFLPTPVITKFDGNPMNYKTFMRQLEVHIVQRLELMSYDSCSSCNTVNLQNEIKLSASRRWTPVTGTEWLKTNCSMNMVNRTLSHSVANKN